MLSKLIGFPIKISHWVFKESEDVFKESSFISSIWEFFSEL